MAASSEAPSRRVVITGLGAVSPFGIGVTTLWDGAIAGKSAIRPLTFFDTTDFTSKIAGEVPDFDSSTWVPKREANRMDRFCLLGAMATKEAIADAGIALRERGDEFPGHSVPKDIDPERFGCYIGSGIGGLSEFEAQHTRLLKKGPKKVSAFTIPKLMANSASGVASILFGLAGPNESVVTACASASHSLGEAFRMIKRNDADIAVAGGSESSVTPLGVAGFCSLKALSTRNDEPERASRPFDNDRDGFVIAEGAGIAILEELEHAKKRGAHIYAEFVGFGSSADAYHITKPCPDGAGAMRAMDGAMKDAGLGPEDIDYINAHGTSTRFNDSVESLAIKRLFGEEQAYKLAVSSTKSMIGHTLGASGGLGLIVTALSIQNSIVHPTINYENKDPECDLDYVPGSARKMQVRAALINSLGFGGHNASMAVAKYDNQGT